MIITDFNLPINENDTINKKELKKLIQERNRMKQEAENINNWYMSTYIMLCDKYQEWQFIIKIFQRRGFEFAEGLQIAYTQEILLDIATNEFINAITYKEKKALYEQRKEFENMYNDNISASSDEDITASTSDNIKNDNIDKQSIHVCVGDTMLQTLSLALYNERIHIYYEGVFKQNEQLLQWYMLNLNNNITERTRNEITKYLKIKLGVNKFEIAHNFITFNNCLYDIKNKRDLPHSNKIFTVNKLNANYNKNVTINNDIEVFLNDITCNNQNRKTAILQIIGYCMTTSVALQKAFVFYGKTAENGKSVLLEVISKLLGKENICSVSIHELQNGRFFTDELDNKLLNAVAELPRTYLNSIEVFKAVVTGDNLSAEAKFQKRRMITPYAKHIFTTNELPKISDTTEALYRRLNILNFEAHFTEDEKRNFDKSKLLTPEAIDYLAYISLQEYLSLIHTRQFANEEESNSIIGTYRKDNNSIWAYLDDSEAVRNAFRGTDIIKKKELYSLYQQWCYSAGYEPKGRNKFYTEVAELQIFDSKVFNGYDCYCLKSPL